VFDEMEDESGAVRPHWQMFVNLLDDLGPRELKRRWDTAKQLIHDNGVTYNVYGDPAGMDRPWNLDTIPLVYGAEEWKVIEKGLAQRARLLDAIAADLYGPQKLLHENLLPAEIVFAHGGFLRPQHGVKPVGNRWLHFYAADIGRSADGQLWVIHDRTQAPSGAGYALENRIVVSRALPDVFRDCRIQRLATFFRTVRDTLKFLAPHNKENPRIVLWTPGPYNETYFEHAYLARYLGYPLVEGGDLTVRDNHVFLKTLGGLQQVDVILRRQDDAFCDPLELRADSALGIPGLVQAIHSGNVTVSNALGTGLLETPALMMFLPRLCMHLLGEELKIPSVGTFWCGDAAARSHVLANLKRMVIKPTYGGPVPEIVFGESLTQAGLEELAARIRACPRDFVGEEQVGLSTAPVLVENPPPSRVEARHVVLRAHLVSAAENPDGFAVMPGGLTRFSASTDTMILSMQKGGGSKDTWVASGGPVDTFSLLAPPNAPMEITRAGGDLPSRVADNLYWLGRYMERAEGLARLARGITTRLIDQNIDSSPELSLLVSTLIHEIIHDPAVEQDEPLQTEEHLAKVLLDEKYPFGLQATLGAIYRIASLVRDRISLDNWRIINRFAQDFPPGGGFAPVSVLPALDRLVITFAAFSGLAMESMTRGYAWRFLEMGRRIERSLNTLTLLRGTLVPIAPREVPLLEALLEVADSSLTYRRRYLASLEFAPVLDLLLADESNPRSVAFQLVQLTQHAEALPRGAAANPLRPRTLEERLLLRTLTSLRLADVHAETQMDAGPPASRKRLHKTLTALIADVRALSDALSQNYLSHALATRQLSGGVRRSP
jgi:uncharacterized circularly permuted ATP-grasp superfamily protein/uncharacterized alpha-E superfamily protein